jgi:peptidoglycan/xylan/chitin deacetylase (PgdA/CDA1 family)
MQGDLRIGLYAGSVAADGWLRVLKQEGLPWRSLEAPGDDTPVTLFDGRLPDWCDRYVQGGGIAVVTAAPGKDVFGPSVNATLHRFRPPEGDRDAEIPCLARLFRGEGAGEIRLHENRKLRQGRLADIYPAIVERRHGLGWFIFTGLPLPGHLAAAGDCLRSFTEPTQMSERVASVDKADIADTLQWMLQRAFSRMGLPYVRLARFPGACPSIFLFRIDVDGLYGQHCRRLASLATQHRVRASFYFNAELCDAHPGELSGEWLEGHEIGHHGERHDLFDTVEENRENLLGGISWVERRLGVRTTGFVAPRGLWNGALGVALRDLGHRYSSDFGLDFDSLPFVTAEGILQIPVHPFSPERYLIAQEEQGLGPPSAASIRDIYLSVLERQVRLRRPVHLYGHPEVLGKIAESVLPPLFEASARLGLPSMTLSDFADWWLARSEAKLQLSVDSAGELDVTISGWKDGIEVLAANPTRLTVEGRQEHAEGSRWSVLAKGAG